MWKMGLVGYLSAFLCVFAAIPESERQALIDIYQATNGDEWFRNTAWKNEMGEFSAPGTEGQWQGVILDSTGEHVRKIQLFFNRLVGDLPNSIADLPHLELLDLSGNELTGTLPGTIVQLPELLTLSIGDNSFTALPDLSPLGKLETLEAGGNLLTGTVPLWILDIPNINRVELEGNQFTGTFPAEFANITRPLRINLASNLITHFPKGSWTRFLKLNLVRNELETSNCGALQDALAQGADIEFYFQMGRPFTCDGMALTQVLPWVSEIGQEWSSSLEIYNPENRPATVRVKQTDREDEQSFIIEGKSHQTIGVSESNSGVGILIYSDSSNLVTTYRVSGLRSPSGDSPALTFGQSIDEGSDHLFFPVLPESLKTAIALLAPQAGEAVPVEMVLYGAAGRIGEGSIILQPGQPTAFLLSDIFADGLNTSDVALEVIADNAVKLFGTAFAFNDLNEPAMMPALPWASATDDLVMPWVASNEQWTSQLALFNPGDGDARVELTARTPAGEARTEVVSIGPKRLLSLESGSLFSDFRGYALRIVATDDSGESSMPIFANQQVGNLEAQTVSPSSALTPAIEMRRLSPLVVLPIPNVKKTPIVVLQAPENQGPLNVEILYSVDRFLTETKTVTLQDANPLPILLADITPSFAFLSGSFVATALSGTPITATFFDFNEFREPSLTRARQQVWVDLGVAVTHIAPCEGESQTRITVTNSGPLSAPPGSELRVVADSGAVVSHILSEPLGVGESVAFNHAEMDFNQTLGVRMLLPPGVVDADPSNNHRKFTPNRALAFGPGYRLHETEGGIPTGIVHADEPFLSLPASTVVLTCGDQLSFEVERLLVGTVGEKHDPQFNYQSQWQIDPVPTVIWVSQTGEIRVEGLETGGVYRIHGIVKDSEGVDHRFENLAHLSRSNYAKADMQWANSSQSPSANHVFHPFDNRNWLPHAVLGRDIPTATSDGTIPVPNTFSEIVQAVRYEFNRDASENVVLELPEGVFDSGSRVYSFRTPNDPGALERRFVIHGAGADKTFFVDSRLAPAPDTSEHFFGFEPRFEFLDFDRVEIRDFAIWGAVPKGNVMEVSGKPVPVLPDRVFEPYSWFSGGIGIMNSQNILITDMDLRFHSVGLSLRGSLADPENADNTTTVVENLAITYGESGILLQDQSQTHLGPGIDIYHVSRQGIFGNQVNGLIVEDVTIDGARQRGINLDQSQRIWIRNNRILNSGQTGIHFGGMVHFAAVTGNYIDTVDRDRPNPFNDQNSVNGETLFYRPVYEAIKSVHGRWGDSGNFWIADNTIRNVADGIGFMQGTASGVLIEDNDIQAWRRGIRLGFGFARTLVSEGASFEAYLEELFVMDNNLIEMQPSVSTDSKARHGVLFPGNDPNCVGCNIDFMDSYGADFGKRIAYYPFPIIFTEPCENDPDPNCAVRFDNGMLQNPGPVYLPALDEADYQHPNAISMPLDEASIAIAAQIRQAILAMLP